MSAYDSARLIETAEWLRKAMIDLRAGTHNLSAEPPILEDTLFHAQQAAEKSLKAYLAWNDIPFRKTHDLRAIGQLCVNQDPQLEYVVRTVARLSQYAWRYRYPGSPGVPTTDEAVDSLHTANELFEEIIQRVPREVIVAANNGDDAP